MLKTSLIIGTLCACIAATLPASAQEPARTSFGLKVGANQAILSGLINEESSYKTAPHFGIAVLCRTGGHFALQPELLYSSQGAHVKRPYDYGQRMTEGDTKLSYITIPLMAKVYIGSVFYIQAGPQVGLLTGAKYKGEVARYVDGPTGPNSVAKLSNEEIDVKDNFKKADVAVCGGFGADFKNGIAVSARLNYGLTTLENIEDYQRFRDRYGLDGMYNRVGQISIGYFFGKK